MAERAEILAALSAIVGPPGLLTEPAGLAPHEIDWRGVFAGKALCAVAPGTAAEVAAVVRFCAGRGLALVPQGGNTGLAGGAVPDRSGRQILLLTRRLSRVLEVDPVGMSLAAEAGCVLKTAQDAAAAAGRLLPVSLAAEGSATIGGIVAANAGGINVLRYGMTRGLVLGLQVVLRDGTLVDGMRGLHKDNAGFDWKQLFIGSEGIFGIVTAAVLRLTPRPAHNVTALVALADPDAAMALLGLFREAVGDQISAFELMSATSLRLVETHFGLASPVAGAGWFVLAAFGSSLAGLAEAAEAVLAEALRRGLAEDGAIAASEAQAARLWALRERITEAEGREGRSVKHDVAVPPAAIPAFIAAAGAAVASRWPAAIVNVFGHAGDGNVHFNVIAPDQEPAAVNRLVHDVVARFHGSISAEHGIGQYRVEELRRYRSAAERGLGAALKRALDPGRMFNPGKVIRPED